MRTLLHDLVSECAPCACPPDAHGEAPLDALTLLHKYLNRYAPILKDSSFREEEEWRIISRPLTASELDYRAGRSMLTPYFSVPLDCKQHPFEITRVIVGPTPHKRQARRSVQALLEKHGIKRVDIDNTTVPYRNW